LSFWQFVLDVLDDDDRVRRLIRLVIVIGPMLGAILSMYYISTQHLPLWGRLVVPSGGVGVSIVYGLLNVFKGPPDAPSGGTLLGQRGSAGEILKQPEGSEQPPSEPGEQ
jgi:hypothetical protein